MGAAIKTQDSTIFLQASPFWGTKALLGATMLGPKLHVDRSSFLLYLNHTLLK